MFFRKPLKDEQKPTHLRKAMRKLWKDYQETTKWNNFLPKEYQLSANGTTFEKRTVYSLGHVVHDLSSLLPNAKLSQDIYCVLCYCCQTKYWPCSERNFSLSIYSFLALSAKRVEWGNFNRLTWRLCLCMKSWHLFLHISFSELKNQGNLHQIPSPV